MRIESAQRSPHTDPSVKGLVRRISTNATRKRIWVPYGNTAVFIIIEPVDGSGAGRLLVGVLPVRLFQLRHTNMLAAHNRVNIYDTRCIRHVYYSANELVPRARGRVTSSALFPETEVHRVTSGDSGLLWERFLSTPTRPPTPPVFAGGVELIADDFRPSTASGSPACA